ncbi:MAG: T9SS type A sorting domain-containing protein [Ignavibacteria bacterium]|nr:T9SS type A sorting domain-containing protein [Ignavibacteria bacterium]
MKKGYVILIILSIQMIFANLYPQAGGRALNLQNADYLAHGDFVYCGAPNYGLTDKLTVCAWVRWTVNPQTYVNVHSDQEGRRANIITLDRHNAKDNGQFWLQHSLNNNNFEWAVQTDTRQNVQSSTVPQQNVWVYLTGVYDGSSTGEKLILYVNGIKEASLSGEISGNIQALDPNSMRLNIGRLPNGYRLFAGMLDEIRIYKRALGIDEIRKQMFYKNTVDNTDLVSYWDMNQPSGTTVYDLVPINPVNGKFYTALIDVHSLTTSPYRIFDDDKSWEVNTWLNCTIRTVAGNGVDEINNIVSNTATSLTFQNPWVTTPKLDDGGTGTGMTWFGVEKTGEVSQWVLSTASVGEDSKIIKTTDSSYVGWAGASLSVKISSVPDNSNNLSIYFWGFVDGLPVNTESVPAEMTKRSNLVWGINEWGTVTSSIFIAYPNILGNFNPSKCRLLQRTRGSNSWSYVNNVIADSVQRTFYVPEVTDFMEYSIGMTDEIMPVSMEYLNYSISGRDLILNWATNSESNNKGFEIYRSANNGKSWDLSGFVNGAGNSNIKTVYTFKDKNLSAGTYQYRLKQIDYNGNFEFFKLNSTVVISLPHNFVLKQNYPNPSNPVSKIDFELPSDSYVKIEIFDLTGRLITKLEDGKRSAGYHSVKFDGSNLSSGIYYYRLNAQSGNDNFIKTYKLVLIK